MRYLERQGEQMEPEHWRTIRNLTLALRAGAADSGLTCLTWPPAPASRTLCWSSSCQILKSSYHKTNHYFCINNFVNIIVQMKLLNVEFKVL